MPAKRVVYNRLTLKFPSTDIASPLPRCLPGGSTDWERHQVEHLHRDAVNALRRLGQSIEAVLRYLDNGNVPESFYGSGGYNLHAYATEAELDLVQLARTIDGIKHRQALDAKREKEET